MDSVFKVNMESILLLAWIQDIQNKSVLEIGSGTGILSIGLSKKFDETLEQVAIDIDSDAILLTEHNIALNQCKSIRAHHSSLQNFSCDTNAKFDVIVSNPPFFETDLKSIKKRNQFSKYTDSLSFNELMTCSEQLLDQNGILYLVLPFMALNHIEVQAQDLGLFVTQELRIITKESKPTRRVLLRIERNSCSRQVEELVMLKKNGDFSNEYMDLTRPYYTIF